MSDPKLDEIARSVTTLAKSVERLVSMFEPKLGGGSLGQSLSPSLSVYHYGHCCCCRNYSPGGHPGMNGPWSGGGGGGGGGPGEFPGSGGGGGGKTGGG